MIFRSLLISAASALFSTAALANASQEMQEGDFLDLVDASGHVTVQGNGVAGVNANAKAQGLSSPAIGYWSPEGHCFAQPAPGPCNGAFKE
jgi:hypothetical protein